MLGLFKLNLTNLTRLGKTAQARDTICLNKGERGCEEKWNWNFIWYLLYVMWFCAILMFSSNVLWTVPELSLRENMPTDFANSTLDMKGWGQIQVDSDTLALSWLCVAHVNIKSGYPQPW